MAQPCLSVATARAHFLIAPPETLLRLGHIGQFVGDAFMAVNAGLFPAGERSGVRIDSPLALRVKSM